MNLFLKFAIVVVLAGLFVSGLLSVVSALFSRVSSETFPRLGDREDDECEYDEHEMLVSGREQDRAALS